jgi:diaminohydroxyphosphoribosylaminopyrimidine deaminase/5-amino-6-(5-phosphoribosylamino)uracil reductase
MKDDNPQVCGQGCQCLVESGIPAEVGLFAERARRLNEIYIKFINTQRPFMTLKLATTLDGRIADPQGQSKWITGAEARKRTHQMRSWHDAVMVGVGTVLADDPQLTVREVAGDNPARIIVDTNLRTPPDARVLGDGAVYIAAGKNTDNKDKAHILGEQGAQILYIDEQDGRVCLTALMKALGEEYGITGILCEGGGNLATALMKERLVDKLIYSMAPKVLGDGIHSLDNIGIDDIADVLILEEPVTEHHGDDVMVIGYPHYAKGN